MSTISVGGLSQFYQSVSVNPPVQADDSTDAVNATTDASSAPNSAAPQQAQEVHYHHHHGGGQFFQKLQTAVTDALQSAKADGSSDPNQVVQNAIENVLKGDQSSTPDGSSDQTNTATDSAASGSIDPQAAREAFFQTLQSYGVDPAQFHQDFLSAIHDARNGNDDPSSAFKSFPPGSNVDTTA